MRGDASGSPPVVQAAELRYTYPGSAAPAVDGVSLSLAAGERLALIGPSGSGKSTLGCLVAGLLKPDSGSIEIPGGAVRGTALEGRRPAAMVFQNPETQLIGSTVEEDVAFGPENLVLPTEVIRRRVDEALAAAGAEHLSVRAIDALSGGEKQRVAVAGALAMAPICLVLDEASSMLHPAARCELEELIGSLEDVAVLQITHDLDEAARADRVALMRAGRLVAVGPPERVLGDERLLAESGLQASDTVRLVRALQKRSVPVDGASLNPEDLVEALLNLWK